MAKKTAPARPGGSVTAVTWVLVAAVAGLGAWAFNLQSEVGKLKSHVDNTIAGLDGRVGALQGLIATAQKAAAQAQQQQQPQRRGPDPNTVYTVKLEGAPVRGGAGAPVTIVEVSDFQ